MRKYLERLWRKTFLGQMGSPSGARVQTMWICSIMHDWGINLVILSNDNVVLPCERSCQVPSCIQLMCRERRQHERAKGTRAALAPSFMIVMSHNGAEATRWQSAQEKGSVCQICGLSSFCVQRGLGYVAHFLRLYAHHFHRSCRLHTYTRARKRMSHSAERGLARASITQRLSKSVCFTLAEMCLTSSLFMRVPISLVTPRMRQACFERRFMPVCSIA
jgi:hypothetical protein